MVDVADEILVQQTLQGNNDAFGTLVERYQRPLFNLALRMTGNYDDASDITQSAFIKAYENLKQYNPQYKFYSWVYRITLNGALNFIHGEKRRETISNEAVSGTHAPDEHIEDDEREAAVQQALLQLTPEYRAVIVLAHLQSKSYKEISEILDVPEKTVKSRLFSARQNLRNLLLKENQ